MATASDHDGERKFEAVAAAGGGTGGIVKRLSNAVQAAITWRAHMHMWAGGGPSQRGGVGATLWCRQLLPHQPSVPPSRFPKGYAIRDAYHRSRDGACKQHRCKCKSESASRQS